MFQNSNFSLNVKQLPDLLCVCVCVCVYTHIHTHAKKVRVFWVCARFIRRTCRLERGWLWETASATLACSSPPANWQRISADYICRPHWRSAVMEHACCLGALPCIWMSTSLWACLSTPFSSPLFNFAYQPLSIYFLTLQMFSFIYYFLKCFLTLTLLSIYFFTLPMFFYQLFYFIIILIIIKFVVLLYASTLVHVASHTAAGYLTWCIQLSSASSA